MKKVIDYTLLIQTVPEISKRDNSVYTCTVGYSSELGFIRLYPMPFNRGLQRWNTYKVEVEKNKQDSRAESWKLSAISKEDNFTNFNSNVVQIKTLKQAEKAFIFNEMFKRKSPSLGDLNDHRRSIGFIYANKVRASWEANENYVNRNQLLLFEDVEIEMHSIFTKQENLFVSKIRFQDEDGMHYLQLNNWQYYMAQKNFRQKGHSIHDAFRYVNDGSQILVVGNLFQHRNIWMVLESFRYTHKTSLFDTI